MQQTLTKFSPLPQGLAANHHYVIALLDIAAALLPEWNELSARMRAKPAIRQKWEARLRVHQLRVTASWTDIMRRDYQVVGRRAEVRVVDVAETLKTGRDHLSHRAVASLHELVVAMCEWPTIAVPKGKKSAGGCTGVMDLRTSQVALFFENIETSAVLDRRKDLDAEFRQLSVVTKDQLVLTPSDDEQPSLQQRFFLLVDRARVHGDALRKDLPDRQNLAWFGVAELPIPTESQFEQVFTHLVPGSHPGAKELFVLSNDLSRYVITKRRHYQDLAFRLGEDPDDSWMLAVGDWADGRSLELSRARVMITSVARGGEDHELRITVEEAKAGRPDLDLQCVPYSTLMRWMADKDKAAQLGVNPRAPKQSQMLRVEGLRDLRLAGSRRAKVVPKRSNRTSV
ncbi:MAG: hypothetical protein ABL997_18985 [Planctomycetota bacterium]